MLYSKDCIRNVISTLTVYSHQELLKLNIAKDAHKEIAAKISAFTHVTLIACDVTIALSFAAEAHYSYFA